MPSAAGRATYLAYRAGSLLARTLPARVAEPVARSLGRGAALTMRGRRGMVERHQRRAATEPLDDAEVRHRVEGAFESYARYWLEMFRLPDDVRAGSIEARFAVEGFHHIEESVARGHGTIMALPHLGGWEFAAAWISGRGYDILAVVEAIEPPALYEWFARVRGEYGVEIVPLGPDVSARVLRALSDNRIVCLVSDRDLTGEGVEVEFFGERTTLPAGPALLALRTDATVLPIAVYFRPNGMHHAVIRPPVPTERTGKLRDDVARITRDLAVQFEELIRAAPEQWHLMQPNWPSDRDGGDGTDASCA